MYRVDVLIVHLCPNMDANFVSSLLFFHDQNKSETFKIMIIDIQHSFNFRAYRIISYLSDIKPQYVLQLDYIPKSYWVL